MYVRWIAGSALLYVQQTVCRLLVETVQMRDQVFSLSLPFDMGCFFLSFVFIVYYYICITSAQEMHLLVNKKKMKQSRVNDNIFIANSIMVLRFRNTVKTNTTNETNRKGRKTGLLEKRDPNSAIRLIGRDARLAYATFSPFSNLPFYPFINFCIHTEATKVQHTVTSNTSTFSTVFFLFLSFFFNNCSYRTIAIAYICFASGKRN